VKENNFSYRHTLAKEKHNISTMKQDSSKYLVNFDARHNILLAQTINKFPPISCGLVEGFFKKDGTGNIFPKSWCGQQELSVCLAVGFIVFQSNGSKPLPTSGIGLIYGKNTTTRRCNSFL
jgi:hypothetical protein